MMRQRPPPVSCRRRALIEGLAFIQPEFLRSCPSSSYRLALSVCAGMRCAAVSRAPLTAARITPGPRERRSRGRCARVSAARWVDVPSGPGTRRSLVGHTHACHAPSRPGRLNQRSLGGSAASRRATSNPHRSRRPSARRFHRTRASGDTDGEAVSTSRAKDDDGARESDEGSLDAAIFALALPAVASLLLDPVLGVVDTAFVGRIRGEGAAEALGGLAVATAVFNFSFKLFNFLAEVTGPLVASQIAAAEAEATALDDAGTTTTNTTTTTTRAEAAETVRGAMTLAVALGIFACVGLELGADSVLRWSGADRVSSGVTNSGVDGGNMLRQAEAHLRVRALSAPAALIGTVAVGAYRGLLDTKTPLLVSGAANAVNLVMDPVLIFGFGPVPAFGVAGAAAATTTAEWIAAVVFWKMLVNEGLLPGMDGETRRRDQSQSQSTTEISGTSKGRTNDTGATENLIGSPGSSIAGWFGALKPLAAGSASQLVRTLILQAVLLRATAEAAGAGAAAPHQICVQVWWVTLFALDALAVAAQSLVASSLGAGDVVSARQAADRCLRLALATGTAVGVGIYAAGPALPGVFTEDPSLIESTRGPLALVASLQPLNAAAFVGDGVLQGAADFDYLAMAMAASAAPAIAMLGAVGVGAETGVAQGAAAEVVSATALQGVWRAMAALQLGRAGTLSWRYWFDGRSPVASRERADEAGKENGE